MVEGELRGWTDPHTYMYYIDIERERIGFEWD